MARVRRLPSVGDYGWGVVRMRENENTGLESGASGAFGDLVLAIIPKNFFFCGVPDVGFSFFFLFFGFKFSRSLASLGTNCRFLPSAGGSACGAGINSGVVSAERPR